MKNKQGLVAVLGIALLLVLAYAAFVSESNKPNWNAPEPRVAGLDFPTIEEVTAKAAIATPEEKAEAVEWIEKFVDPIILTDGWSEHLLAVRDSIPMFISASRSPTVRAQGEVDLTRRADGFMIKYQIPGYSIQIMEATNGVILGITDEGDSQPKATEAERLAFLEEMVERFVVPQPAQPPDIAENLEDGTWGFWSPVRLQQFPNGGIGPVPEELEKSDFSSVQFWTDGKSVILEADKQKPDIIDYTRARFQAHTPPRQPVPGEEMNEARQPGPPPILTPEEGEGILKKELTPEELANQAN